MSLLDMTGSLFGDQQQGGGFMQVVMGLVNEHGGLQGLISMTPGGELPTEEQDLMGMLK